MAIQLMIHTHDVEKISADWNLKDYTLALVDQEKFRGMVLICFGAGRVLALVEKNGYQDSDFSVVYQTDSGFIVTRNYGTTRAWCYNNNAYVDATKEMYVEWEAQQAKEREYLRKEREAFRLEELTKLAAETNTTVEGLRRLENALGTGDGYRSILVLLRTKRFRSEFRSKLCAQVRVWMDEENPKYNYPLSAKQMLYI